jgi:hypothetical protein
MADASSNTIRTCSSCVPAKLSELCSVHGIAEANHVSGLDFISMRVALTSNHAPLSAFWFHLASSRQVLESSWFFVLAVTTICGFGRVAMNQ